MSNGEYKSIEHRAVVNQEKERLSIAAFHSPILDAMVGPLPDLVKEKGAKYKSITNEEYLRLVITSKLDGKSFLDDMKLGEWNSLEQEFYFETMPSSVDMAACGL